MASADSIIDLSRDGEAERKELLKAIEIFEICQSDDYADLVKSKLVLSYYWSEDFENAGKIRKELNVDSTEHSSPTVLTEIYLNLFDGYTRKDSGQFQKSLLLFEYALEKLDSHLPNNLRERSKVLNALFYANVALGEYEKAIPYLEMSVACKKKMYGPENAALVISYSSLGGINTEMGDFEKALNYYDSASVLVENLDLEDSEITQSLYYNIGALNYHLQSFSRSLEYFQKALNIIEKDNRINSLDYAYVMISMGSIYSYQLDFDKSLQFYFEAVKVLIDTYGEQHLEVAATYNNIGLTYSDKSDYEKSVLYLQKALDINSKNLGEIHPETAENIYSLADAYKNMGKKEEAILNYEKYLQVQHKLHVPGSRSLITTYNNLGNSYLDISQEQSIRFLNESIKANLKVDDPEQIPSEFSLSDAYDAFDLLDAVRYKGQCYLQLYEKNQSQKYLEMAIDQFDFSIKITEKVRRTFLNQEDLALFERNSRYYLESAVMASSRSYQISQDPRYMEKLFGYMEQAKSQLLLISQSEQVSKKKSNIPESILSKEYDFKAALNDLEYEKQELPDTVSSLEIDKRIFDLSRKYERFIGQLEKDYPSYHQLKYQERTTSLFEIQQNLNPSEAMISYFLGEVSSLLICITEDTTAIYDLPEKEIVESAVDAYYNVIQNESNISDFQKQSYQLYRYLIEPAEKILAGKQNLIITHPSLLSVPFEAIVSEALPEKQLNSADFSSLSYLINQYNMSYHYSGSLWNLKRNEGENTGEEISLVALAPFSEGAGKVLKTRSNNYPLPESKVEVNKLYELFSEKDYSAIVGFSNSADQRLLFEGAQSSSILHIATHSEVDYRNQNLARIHLAECLHQDVNHRKSCIYPADIYTMNIKSDLVVLSSCDSGAGKVWNSEGVMSLGRAFLNAGANSVISSLWEADDVFSRLLMVDFYETYLGGNSYNNALNKAKRSMIKNQEWNHPKYWSNFILIGN